MNSGNVELLKPFLESEKEQAAEIERWKHRADAHEQNYLQALKRIDALVEELNKYRPRLEVGSESA